MELSQIRIPTLIGLPVLIFGLVAGVYLVNTDQFKRSQASTSVEATQVELSNLSSTTVSVSWQTDDPQTGFVKAGETGQSLDLTFPDERDQGTPTPHLLHQVTLSHLKPDTPYSIQIYSGSTFSKELLNISTPGADSPQAIPSLIGQVRDEQGTPVQEALVTLKIDGAYPLSAITKQEGNFILPLSRIFDSSGTESFPLSANTPAELIVTSGEQTSLIQLTLPYQGQTLPAITLGKNEVFTAPLPTATPQPSLKPTGSDKYDLNSDGVVNSIDLGIVQANKGTQPKSESQTEAFQKSDLNGDGVVDQQDSTLLSQYLSSKH